MATSELVDELRMLDKSSPQPVYQQLGDLIQDWIARGVLGPGDRVPSETELARETGISRMTARRALMPMVIEGVLFRQPGKGTFVAEPKLDYTLSTLISFSRLMKRLGHVVSTKVLEQCVVPAPSKVGKQLRLKPREDVVKVRRLRAVDGRPVAVHTSYFRASVFSGLLDQDLANTPLWEAVANVNGVKPLYTNDVIEATVLRPEEAALLKRPVSSPGLLISGVACDGDKRPVRFAHCVYRADCIRFEVRSDRAGALLELTLR
jgi:GntR family transcriptional regulator